MVIDQRAAVLSELPEGVFRDPRGRLMHYRYRFAGFVQEDGEPWTSEADGPRYEEHDEIAFPCIVPPPYAEVDEVFALQKRAANLGQDFLHPEHGWLYGGRKRVTEYPENMGSGSVRHPRRRRLAAVEAPAPINAAPGATDESQGSMPVLDTPPLQRSTRQRVQTLQAQTEEE